MVLEDIAAYGWPVFPVYEPSKDGACACGKADCDDRGKHPRVTGWQEAATTDKTKIRRWQRQWPETNAGLPTGARSGVVVLDIDPRHGGDESLADLERQHGPLPETPRALTGGGGEHRFFAHPGSDVRIRNRTGLLPGIDVRGDGGYVVAPGSHHVSGGAYEWDAGAHPDDMPLAPLPHWLLALLVEPSTASGAPPEGSRGVPLPVGQRARQFIEHGAPIGSQRETAVSTARNLLAGGRSVEETADALWQGLQASAWEQDREPWTYQAASAIAQDIASSPPAPLRNRNGHRPNDDLHTESDARNTAADEHPPRADQHVVNLTELGNARRLVRQAGADIRFCSALGWLTYDGIRWRPDDTGEVERRAKQTVMNLYREAAGELHKEARDALVAHGRKSETNHQLTAMVDLAKSEPTVPVRVSDLDRDPWALNLLNGTLDLGTGTLRPHRRKDLITKLAPVAYDPDATCPLWLHFLDYIMESNTNLISFIQRMFGLCLTAVTTEQVLFMLYGTGANGKSTAVNTFLALLGDYGRMAAPGLLLRRRHEAHPTERADLYGSRLVASVEIDQGRALAEALVKEMTGGERMKGRLMRRDFFEWEPTHKLLLCCNHRPAIKGTDNAIWRRIRLIPFTVAIPPGEQDKDLRRKLAGELPGILRWAVEGCLAWQHDGLGVPDEVVMATDAYRAGMDVLGAFLNERTYQGPSATCTVKALYDTYKAWCEANGERAESKNNLSTLLAERGCTPKRRHGGQRLWEGLGMLSESEGDTR